MKLLLAILLRGTLQFRNFNEIHGETTIESRKPLSLMGIAAFPSDPLRIARITAGDVAVLGCADGKEFHSVRKEAFGIHRMERVRLAHQMKLHPVFARFSAFDRFLISLFFYKVKLPKGETLLREGKVPQFLLFVDQGSITRSNYGSEKNQNTTDSDTNSVPTVMGRGSFPALEALVHGRPSDATYTVQSDETVLFVLPPAVLEAFTGNRPFCTMHLLEQLRGPKITDVIKMVESIVKRFHFTRTDELLHQMRTSFSTICQEEPFEVDEATEERLISLSNLLEMLFPQKPRQFISEQDSRETEMNEENEWFEIPSVLEALFQVISGLLIPSGDDESESQIVVEPPKYQRLCDFGDDHILAALQSLLYKYPADSAKYLLFLELCGETELVTLPKEKFISNAKAAGILTEENKSELLGFFFDSSSVLTFDAFLKKLQSSSTPAIIASTLKRLQSLVEQIAPDQATVWEKQQSSGIRKQMGQSILKLYSPFQLLSLPLPVPYVMTYSLRFQNYRIDYWKYIIGGFFGEIFVDVFCMGSYE